MEACKTKFVPTMIKKTQDKFMRNSRKALEDVKKLLKKETDEEKKKELTTKKQFWEDTIQGLLKMQKENAKKIDKKQIDELSKQFCNPGCVGTLFQETELSETDLKKMFEWAGDNESTLIKDIKKTRKNLRKGRKTILKDNFYHAVDPKTKKRLIKEGALSGCIIGL
jgi:hypothetical protein